MTDQPQTDAQRKAAIANKPKLMAEIRRIARNRKRREREAAYRDLGMIKVRGNLGGTYYE